MSPAACASACCALRPPQAGSPAPCGSPDVLLIDHANCEKKAASTALALMFAYAEDLELADKMSRLAREELRHYEQVARLIKRLRVQPQRLAPGRYARAPAAPGRKNRAAARGRSDDLRRLHRGALLRALRGSESGLGGAAGRSVRRLCMRRRRAIAQVYLDLARRAATRAGIDVAERIDVFAALEAELITEPRPAVPVSFGRALSGSA